MHAVLKRSLCVFNMKIILKSILTERLIECILCGLEDDKNKCESLPLNYMHPHHESFLC